MVRSVCEVARCTKLYITCSVLIYVLCLENCYVWHLCSFEGAGNCNVTLLSHNFGTMCNFNMTTVNSFRASLLVAPLCTMDHTMTDQCLYLKHINYVCLCYYSQFGQLEVVEKA